MTVVLAIGTILFLAACYHAIGFTWDDPFISYRYARNLAEGHGLVYNIGERVEGYSNLLFVLICAFIYKTGIGRGELGLLYFSKVFGLACALGSAALAWHFIRRWDFNASIGYLPLALFAPLMLLTNVFFAGWSMGGMETVFFPLLLMAASYMLLIEVQRGRAFHHTISFPALVFWLAALTRPEGPALWLAALIAMLSVRKRYEIEWRHIGSFVITFVVLMLAFILHRFIYFGELLPNTYYAKATGGYEQIINGLYNFTSNRSYAFIGNVIPVLVIFLPLCMPRMRNTFGFRLIFIQVLIYLLFIISSGKDWMGGYRFFIHILPLMAVGASMGVISLFSMEKRFHPANEARPVFQKVWLLVLALLLFAPPVVLKLMLTLHPVVGKRAYIEWWQFILGFGFLLVILIAVLVQQYSRPISDGAKMRRWRPVTLILIIIVLVNLDGTGWRPGIPAEFSFLGPKVFEFESGFTRWPPLMMIEKYRVMGEWLRDNTDTDGYLAIGEAGAIPYISGHPIVDCFGLMDKTIARMPGTTFFDKSDSREAADYVLGKEPKYFLFKGTITSDGKEIIPGWREFHYIQHIYRYPGFREKYRHLYTCEDFIVYERVE